MVAAGCVLTDVLVCRAAGVMSGKWVGTVVDWYSKGGEKGG